MPAPLDQTKANSLDTEPLAPDLAAVYETVYAADLVYVKDCWQLCGDAHCCSFKRYKSQYRVIAQQAFQELPLLPGEWRWLQRSGWAAQFEPCEYRLQQVLIDGRSVRYESVVSRRPGCACNHATRPTICRLYPLLPCYDLEGRLVGVEKTGIYEEMEAIGGLPSACRIEHVPMGQLTPFLSVTSALSSSPLLRWHLEAYRLAKQHVAARLSQRVAQTGKDVFVSFESALLRGALFDTPALHAELAALMRRFDSRWPDWDQALLR